jgi:hypothetical protein
MTGGESRQVQYRVAVSKADELVSGPDDADLIVSVPLQVVTQSGFDATTEFIRGRLKAVGPTGVLFDVLSDGAASAELTRLASQREAP